MCVHIILSRTILRSLYNDLKSVRVCLADAPWGGGGAVALTWGRTEAAAGRIGIDVVHGSWRASESGASETNTMADEFGNGLSN